MKSFLLFLLTVFIGTCISLGYYAVTIKAKQTQVEKTVTDHKSSYNVEVPPANSLKGTMSLLKGEVKWESRTATEPATLTNPREIMQGERLITGDNGHVDIVFSNNTALVISPKSEVSIVQTLPVNLAFVQPKGTIQYTSTSTISVKNRRLLVTSSSGTFTISLKDDDPSIVVAVKKGVVTVAYNDANNTSQVITVGEGKVFNFDNDDRQGSL